MRSKLSTWFECKIKYEKVMEDGLQKQVVEQYIIDALSFTEAEERITENMSAYISGAFEVKTCAIAPFGEIFFSDEVSDDRWYKVKLAFISIDEKTMKEKRSNVTYLVQAATINRAVKNIDNVMQGSLANYLITSVAETPIMDVFEYVEPEICNALDVIDGKDDSGAKSEA